MDGCWVHEPGEPGGRAGARLLVIRKHLERRAETRRETVSRADLGSLLDAADAGSLSVRASDGMLPLEIAEKALGLLKVTGKLISDEKRLRYTGTEYLKSEEEMGRLFADR